MIYNFSCSRFRLTVQSKLNYKHGKTAFRMNVVRRRLHRELLLPLQQHRLKHQERLDPGSPRPRPLQLRSLRLTLQQRWHPLCHPVRHSWLGRQAYSPHVGHVDRQCSGIKKGAGSTVEPADSLRYITIRISKRGWKALFVVPLSL